MGDVVELRPTDRLILVMLSEIYDALKIDGEIDTKFLRAALFSGQDWALDWDMAGIVKVESTEKAVVSEVVDILEMYDMLEFSYGELLPAEQASIKKHEIRFPGFDGNNEGEHMGVARFLVEDMDRWSRFKGFDFNSHHETLSRAKRMVKKFKALRPTFAKASPPLLTVDQIADIVSH